MFDIQTKTTFKIFYQYVRGFRTKQTELLHMAFSMDFQIICLTETWLKARCCDHKVFPDSFTVLTGPIILNLGMVVY